MASKKTIAQRISLDGGAEIKREFEALGEAGAKAFEEIKRSLDTTSGPFQTLSRNVANVRKDLVPVGKAFSDLGRSIATFGRNLALITGAIAGASAGVVAFTRAATAAADEVGKAAQGVGLAAEAYQRLQFAAEQSGIAQGDFVTGMTRLNQEIGKAAAGNKASTERFKQLGVAIKDANGNMRPTEAILSDIASAFARMPADARKAQLGSELFGRSIARWLPLLNEGREGIAALGHQFDADIGGFSEAQIRLATRLNDAWNAMGRALTSLRHQIGLAFAPSLLRGIEAFRDMIGRNREAIIGFAESITASVEPAVKDLFATLAGNDSEVVDRRFIAWRDSVVGFGRDLLGVVRSIVVPAFQGLVAAADGVAGALRTLTGGFVDFTGRQALMVGSLVALTGGFRVLRDAVYLVGVALTFLAKHPVVAGITAIAGVTAYLATRQTDAQRAAAAHADAMTTLDDIMRRVRAGVEGATEELAEFRYQQLQAGQAALQNAQDQIKAMQMVAQAEIGATVGGVDPADLEKMVSADPRVQQLSRLFAQLSAEVAEAEASFKAAAIEANKSDREFAEVGQTAKETGELVAGAGEKIIRVFRGGEMTELAVPVHQAREAAEGLGTTVEAEGQKIETALAGAATGAGDLAAKVAEVPTALTEAGNAATGALEPMQTAFVGIETQANQTATAIPGLFVTAGNAIAEAFASAFTRIKAELGGLQTAVTTALNAMTAALAALRREIAAVKAAASSAQSSASSGGGGSGFAFGGPVRGPGTSTSDSIPAWLSDGEFVLTARAVRRYGLRFIRALNEGILPRVPGFAAGGLVQGFNFGGLADAAMHSLDALRPQPMGQLALAGIGGSSQSTTPVHLNFGNGETVVMQAVTDSQVINALHRVAQGQKRRSTGGHWAEGI